MSPPIPVDLMEELRKFVAGNLGLHFPIERWDDLERGTIAAAAEAGCETPQIYVRNLLSSPARGTLVDALAANLTVGETYFFRHPKCFEALENHILPELIARRRKSRCLRIWSAGCATGEEPYSIAILLKRILPDLGAWNISILATDVNLRFLDAGAAGIFREWSFRDAPSWVKDRFFRATDEGRFEIGMCIKEMVTFSRHNLAQDPFPSVPNDTHAMDLILCRNVLMYFTDESKAKVISCLHQSLADGGWLAVSSCELSPHLFSGFATVGVSGLTWYRKQAGVKKAATTARPVLLSGADTATGRQLAYPPEQKGNGIPAERRVGGTAVPDIRPAQPGPKAASPYEEAVSLCQRGEYSGAEQKLLSSIRSGPADVTLMVLLARVYANQGRLAEAREWSEKALSSDKLNPDGHYLRAIILEAQEKGEEAVRELKRLLYLDPRFVLAHFALGNLARRLGRTRESEKHFRNALSLLKDLPPEDVLTASEGLTAGRLIEIINSTSRKKRNG